MVGACMYDTGVTVQGAAAAGASTAVADSLCRTGFDSMRQAKMRRAATPATGALRTRRE